jgi:hypothetical protein
VLFFKFLWSNVSIVMRKEGKKKGRISHVKKIPKTALFGHTLKKQHIHFLMHGHFSWSVFGLHLVKGPKA